MINSDEASFEIILLILMHDLRLVSYCRWMSISNVHNGIYIAKGKMQLCLNI